MDERERFAAARRIFLAAGEEQGAEQAARVERECAGDAELLREVLELLAQERAADPRLEAPAMSSLLAAPAAAPERIGEFRILGVLGTGGMGVVYEAEQANPRRHVALKVIRSPFAGAGDLRRFEQEGRALGWLNHPGIATIYATGVADAGHGPEPYLAMELVRGERLDRHAERVGLGVPARLELLARLCDGVHHAHEKGVIHRDLKPSNVLVDETGRPKILDFGVARITGGEIDAMTRCTSAGQIVGTLPYMSPEQLGADPSLVDVRSDVYALGVIGYELLCGRRPLEIGSRDLPEALRAIANDEPMRLGTVDRRLRGEVETIVHKAMAKERERRYGSAADLAADLRRHLADEPILARPASRSYQLRKFARRNRVLVGGIAAVFLVLLAGTITSTLLYLEKEDQRTEATQRGEELAQALARVEANLERALSAERVSRQEEARARTEADTTQAVTDYLVSLFEHANPELGSGKEVTAFDLLDRGVERIRGQFEDRPAIRARLLNVFGKIDNFLQRFERSRPILEEALRLTADVHGEDSAEYADTLERLAWVHHVAGDMEGAEAMQRQVLALRDEHLGRESALYADALNNLANTLMARNAYAEARDLLDESLASRTRLFGPDHEAVASSHFGLGSLLGNLGRDEEAGEHYQAALAGFEQHLGPTHWRTLVARVGLAENLRDRDRPAEALEAAKTAHEGLAQLFGEESLMTTRALCTYAACLQDAGHLEESVRILEELLARHEGRHGRDVDYGDILVTLASALQDLERNDEAEALYLDALDLGESLLHREERLSVRHNLAVIYSDTGRLDEALALELAVLSERDSLLGPGHRDTRGSLNNLAGIYGRLGRTAEEEAVRRRKLAAVLDTLGPGHWAAGNARIELVEFLERTGRAEEARALLAGE